ncbi:MAG TPA: hypothetical protein DCG33_05305 [Prevotellaceae bacterium]|jgi:RND family efflux transporter MFP subunit|nr:hypothetical protein [Prevotellaceae bacterium]
MKYIQNVYILALVAMMMTGCMDSALKREEHHHEHNNSIQMTAYNGGMELFAEITPMVVAEEVTLTAHCTHLDTFKPVTEGRAVATIDVAGHKIVLKKDTPDRSGVYQFVFTPQHEGSVTVSLEIKHQRGSARFLLDSLTVFKDRHDAHEDAEHRAVHHANAVAFPKEMSWESDFSTMPVRRTDMGGIIHTVAQIQPSQGDEITVSAKVGGMATLVSNTLTEGSYIGAGQAICRIDASATADNNLRVQYAQASAEYNRAKSEYERLQSLERDRLVTTSQLSDAKGKYESAEAIYNNLRKNFSSGSQSVTVPRGGFIKEILFKNGEFVTAGQSLLTITQNRSLRLVAHVQPRYFDQLKHVIGANIRLRHSDNVHTLESLGGRMVSYSRQISVDNPLIAVTFEINNVGAFLPGSFVEMFIKTSSSGNVIVVPAEAVLEDMGNYFVYVQITPELFEKRQVNIGETDGKDIEITDGLKGDERIVARGSILIKLQQSNGAVDPHAGHNH